MEIVDYNAAYQGQDVTVVKLESEFVNTPTTVEITKTDLTIAVYDELFSKLYSEPEFDKYVCNSNSYILFNELFHVYKLYDGSEEIIESGIFAVKNNKTTGQLAHEENNCFDELSS